MPKASPPITRIPEAPRDPKLGIDASGRRWATKQSPSELPQADDDERDPQVVAEEANP